MSEKRNVPQLRFPGFTNSWEYSKAGDLFSVSAGGDIPKENVSQEQTDEFPYPIFANAAEGKGLYGYSDVFKIEPPAITIAGRGVNVGISHVRTSRFYPIVRLLVLKPKKEGVADLKFFERVFNNLNIFIESTGVPQLTAPQISSYGLAFPSLPEQQKIAEFLTAVDHRIELLQAKKEKLEAYKKGVMQKIFPSTGSGQAPQLRFKADDGSEFPDWEERKLGEVLDYEQPTKYLVSSTEYNDSYPTPVLTAGKTFLLGYTDETTGIFTENLPTIIFDDFTTAFQYVDFPFKAKSSAMKMLVPREPSVIMKYVYEAMLQIKFVPGDHKRHWISEFQEFEIPYPSEAEQKKIVQFLTSMDSTINNLNQQITQTQTWKKGLLQKMFV
ncbi:restriction endonuclease subunit S [Algoriphagus marincola]|uniref:restriction endonuclease subunit S n=1 Tax=Algoriphagus marincola TaxID=264027 RepID=UPI000402F500|nr:restriction endonuclease subunit S [Algoriphagus marincola]